ncbi:MAG: GDSL family lipase [Planctomycetaceae bacterium]|nr:GDSL family lipase [Planctomycetales bacterium]MCB9938357.1 GDSL family lipase [Planctomycetaceae bacterium]
MKIVPRTLLLALAAVVLIVPVRAEEHDAIKPVPRDGNWMKRHEAMNARVKEGNVDLVFIGDSITQGWEGRGKEVWQKFYDKRNAVNLGIGGDRTQHVIWRLDNGNLEGISPKLAVIMIGTNNSGTNTPEQIADGTTAIVKQLRTKTPQTKILVLGVFPRGESPADPKRQVNEKTNAIVSKLADGEHVFYLDFGKNFLQDDGTLTREIMPDLLHLNEQSYAIWAESIEPMVVKLMGE